MSSDLAPRLDSAYVEETVGRLEARVRARFPDRRLGDAAHSLQTAVPQIHLIFGSIAVCFLWALPEHG